ncbi:cell wall surface anchor family protein [Fulvimarina pelagi HTCC2506]|uniref:Cell wall surface anchor family protein n=2 Tax=Fulvimarina pelagi TaxID=217511 RepID=Q0FZJ0_9HYPH|nr:hypothetical protein [Fulvimarina pelagi]EAU40288.1 cell wall surface anchor family protein [Fulvimarina pelagi HTCC2506]BAT31328.1 cell wall surface anchor family protein [Fulvimarina pelagi]
MTSWTSMIATGTALALVPLSGNAQQSDGQCAGVPNSSGIELLISVEGAPGRYRLTCQNGALVAVPAEVAGLATSPTPSEQAMESAASTVGAMISGEMEIGRNMAGVGSADPARDREDASGETAAEAMMPDGGDVTPRTEEPLLEDAKPDGVVPRKNGTVPASEEEASADLATTKTEAESFAEEPKEKMPQDIPAMATVDESTGTTDEAPVVSDLQGTVTESGPGSLEQQMDAAIAGNGSSGTPSKRGPGTLEQQMAAATAQSAESNEDATADAETSEAESEDGTTSSLEATGVPSKSGPGTLEQQMEAAIAGNGSSGTPSKRGPGTLEQQMAAATAQSTESNEDATADEATSVAESEDGTTSSLEATGVPSKSGPGTLEQQMDAAIAGNGSSGTPSKRGPGTLEQQMSAATAQSTNDMEDSTSDDASSDTASKDDTTSSLEATGVPSKSGPGTLEEQMDAAIAGNGSSGSPSKRGPGTLEQQMSAATAQSAEIETETSDEVSGSDTTDPASPSETSDELAAVTTAPISESKGDDEADRIAVPAEVVASARLALPGVEFQSVSVREESGTQLFALRGAALGGTPVSVAVEPDGQIVSIDREVDSEQVPEQVNRIATALLPDRLVNRVMLSTRENYMSYFVFRGVDSQSVPFALEVRSDGQEARFVRAN